MAEQSDATFLAWVVLAGARSHLEKGWFDIVLGRSERECLDYLRRLTLTTTRSWWHYSRFRIADVDGRAGAALGAFRAGDGYPLSQAALVEAARSLAWSDDEQDAMWSRGAYLFTCLMESNDDLWTIENVATVPELRKRGLARALLEEALADGRSQGFPRVQITFLIGNDEAERTYSGAGFTFDDERRHPDFQAAVGAPGLRRFVRDL
jgi:ribosomal protein S18 acetylase RimI-like enzyme